MAAGFPRMSCVIAMTAVTGAAAAQPSVATSGYIAEVTRARQVADRQMRGPFSPLAKIQSHQLQPGRALVIGSGPDADAQLKGLEVAPVHAVIEGDSNSPTVRAIGRAWITTMSDPPRAVSALTLRPGWGFRIGRFVFEYGVSVNLGRVIHVFDPDAPAVLQFGGLEYFPIDPAYRVRAEVVPSASPVQLELLDSRGNLQKFWLYGELRFSLQGASHRLELYTDTLDGAGQRGFMLIFADATSGKDTYPAARYLNTDAPRDGAVTVDFNRAYNPPCVYSELYACPYPRPNNRLPIRVEAGAKWYRPKGN